MASRVCRLGDAIVLTVILGAGTASGVTRGCESSPGAQLLQLDHRTATRLLLSQIRPAYPPLAQINYIHGHVRLLVSVNCQGKVQQVHVVRGHPFLAVAALQAIRRWVYRPFVTRSGPAGFQTTVDVDFSLFSPNIQRFPPQPEKFLARWVRPPQIVTRPVAAGAGKVVRVRVLVNDTGRVLDSTLLAGTPTQFEAARRAVAIWKFKPARWGNIDVPWYSEVDVPLRGSEVKEATMSSAAGDGQSPRLQVRR